MMSRLPARGDDTGASLVLALIFITSVSLVVSALLTYSSTGLRSAKETGDAVQSTTDVGGALNTAITDVRNSDYFNVPTPTASPCLNAGNQKTYQPRPASDGGEAITVTCTPDSASGGAGGLVQVNNSNRPSLAVLTLGTGAETGIDKPGNRPLKIKGAVYSNKNIQAAGGTACPTTWPPPSNSTNCNGIFVQGPNSNPGNVSVLAETGCVGTVVVAPGGTRNCAAPHAAVGDDPATIYPTAYGMPAAGMTPQTLPTCGSNPVTFEPGYYDDAVGLSALTANNGTGICAGKTFWFKPGIYYFDFHNSEMPTSGSPIIPNGSNVWRFNDPGGVLVAGTKQGWTTSTSKDNMPGACVSPLTSMSTAGVQFVFGGDSQFQLSKGSAEICGTWHIDKPSLMLYGAKHTVGTIESATLLPRQGTLASTTSPAFSPLGDNSLGNGSDGGTGPKVTNLQKSQSSTLQVNGFTGLSSAIAPRAVLEQATVRVRHREVGANAGTTLTLSLTPNRSGASAITRTLTVGASTIEQFDITAALRDEIYGYGLADAAAPFTARVTITADAANGQKISEEVDYLDVALSWRPIAVRAQSGCVIQVAGCSMLQTDIQTEELYLQGTAYTPLAKLDIRLVGVTGQVFRAGLIARAVKLEVSPSNNYDGPLIELPDNTLAPSPLKVYLTAWSCPTAPAAPCATPPSTGTGWIAKGRALVKYTDASFIPMPGNRAVEVQSWHVAR